MGRLVSIIIMALLVGQLAGCAKKVQGGAVAIINGKGITMAMLDEEIENLPEQYKVFASQHKRDVVDEMIIEQLLYEEAKNRRVERDPEIKKLKDEAARKIIISKVIDDEMKKSTPVSEDDMKAYYEKNKERYLTPDMVRASHILTSTEEEAKEALGSLSTGMSFEDVAKKYSKDLTKDRGGDLGYFKKGQMIPEFEKVVFSLKVGEISDVVKTRFGYHIIKLTDYKPSTYLNYEDVKDNISLMLSRERQEDRFKKFTEDLKSKAKIEIREDLLVVPAQEADVPSPAETQGAVEEMVGE